MGLIVEIVLAIVAWRRGWKAWALLPLGAGVVLAFIVGFIIGLSDEGDDFPVEAFAIFDLVIIVVMIIMIAKPREIPSGDLVVSSSIYRSPKRAVCPDCNCEIPDGSKFCPMCGSSTMSQNGKAAEPVLSGEAIEAVIECNLCGKEVKASSISCPYCGAGM